MSGVAHKLHTANIEAEEIEVVEVTADSPVHFSREDLATVYCFDLNKCDVKCAASWLAQVKRNNRVLPQILVVGPQRRLSNSEFKFIAAEIAPWRFTCRVRQTQFRSTTYCELPAKK
jgi:hypothetical protein